MGRRGYPPEFRRKVLDLLEEGRTLAQVAHDLDISELSIYTWRHQDRIDKGFIPGLSSKEKSELPAANKRIAERQKVTVEVGGRRLEVVLPAGLGGLAGPGTSAGGAEQAAKRSAKKAGAAASGDAVTSPMQGTIVKVVVEEGQQIAEGDTSSSWRR